MADSGPTLSNLSTETRSFPPSAEFAAQANATEDWYARADEDREGFWAEQADRLTWATKWDKVLEWDAPFAKWFVGGKLNVAVNCVDRHVEAGHGEQVAFHWEGEPGDSRTITYADLQREVCKAANALTELGCAGGRPGGDPDADDPRGGGRHAGVRASGRDAQRGVRRLLAERAEGPHRGRRGEAADHHRRPVPPRQARADEGEHRPGRRRDLDDRARAGRAAHRDRGAVDRGSRRVVARHRRPPVRHPRGRGVRRRDTRCSSSTPRAPPGSRRASCTPPVATSPRRPTRTTSCSTTSRARASTGAPPTSAGSPGTATSSTGRWPTGPRPSCTRAPRTPRTRAATGRSSRSTASRSTTPRPR